MKLPQDPKERIQVLALIGIGATVVIIALVALVVKPLLGRKTEHRQDIAKTKEELDAARHDISRMMQERSTNIRVLEEIVNGADHANFILKPRLGNYQLGAREFVDGIAQDVGLTIESMREIGISLLPQADPEKAYTRALKCYSMTVQLNAGLHDLARFLDSAERGNPYLCVTSIAITTRAEDPARHQIILELQWPVWFDPAMGEQLEKRLQDANAFVPSEHPNT